MTVTMTWEYGILKDLVKEVTDFSTKEVQLDRLCQGTGHQGSFGCLVEVVWLVGTCVYRLVHEVQSARAAGVQSASAAGVTDPVS